MGVTKAGTPGRRDQMTITTIKINSITDSSCADYALDIGLRVTLADGSAIDGEVTLVPGAYDDTAWVSWGQLDHWMSDALIAACADEDGDHDRRAADAIETAAAKAAASYRDAWDVAAKRDAALYL